MSAARPILTSKRKTSNLFFPLRQRTRFYFKSIRFSQAPRRAVFQESDMRRRVEVHGDMPQILPRGQPVIGISRQVKRRRIATERFLAALQKIFVEIRQR